MRPGPTNNTEHQAVNEFWNLSFLNGRFLIFLIGQTILCAYLLDFYGNLWVQGPLCSAPNTSIPADLSNIPTSYLHTHLFFFFLENSQVRLVLFICASLCDHPLEQGKHISCHTINDKWFSLTQLPRATQWGEWSPKVSLLLCQNCGWLVFVQVMCRLLSMPHNVCKTAFHAAPIVLQHNPNQIPYDFLYRTCFLVVLSLACCYFRNMKFFIRLCIRNIYDLFLKVAELQLSF